MWVPEVGFGPLVVCSLLLSAFLLFAWCVACEYGSISRFKGVFSVVWGVRVGLCCLGALRGLWGFCARVELGGFRACCVFAFHFVFSPCFLSSCIVFPFLLLLWLCIFFFPCGCTDKKKGRNFLRPLLSCCGLVYKSLNITVISCGSSLQ